MRGVFHLHTHKLNGAGSVKSPKTHRAERRWQVLASLRRFPVPSGARAWLLQSAPELGGGSGGGDATPAEWALALPAPRWRELARDAAAAFGDGGENEGSEGEDAQRGQAKKAQKTRAGAAGPDQPAEDAPLFFIDTAAVGGDGGDGGGADGGTAEEPTTDHRDLFAGIPGKAARAKGKNAKKTPK